MLTLLLLLGRYQNKVIFFLVDLVVLMYSKVFLHLPCFPLVFPQIMLFSFFELNFELRYGPLYRFLHQHTFLFIYLFIFLHSLSLVCIFSAISPLRH